MSAIEVLKKEKELYLEKIKDINKANETRPEDIAEMYKKSIKTYEEFISALNEALLALEQKDVKDTEIKLLHKQITDYERILNGLNEWLEKEIDFGEKKINECYIECGVSDLDYEYRNKTLKEVLERVGEQK
jgi:DNA-binding transcriptional regulator GbsR (MarR family)